MVNAVVRLTAFGAGPASSAVPPLPPLPLLPPPTICGTVMGPAVGSAGAMGISPWSSERAGRAASDAPRTEAATWYGARSAADVGSGAWSGWPGGAPTGRSRPSPPAGGVGAAGGGVGATGLYSRPSQETEVTRTLSGGRDSDAA
jgi:hypothetical protein